MIHIDKDLDHKLCLTYMCKLQFWQAGSGARIIQIEEWLDKNIGIDNYSFEFEDYGQHGEWMLYTRSREDLSAFMLRWSSV